MSEWGNEGRERLIEELSALACRVAQLERSESEHRQTLRTLGEKEETMRLFFEKSEDPAILLEDGTYIDCNEAAVKLVRASGKDRLIGLSPVDISPERQPDGTLSSLKMKEMNGTTLAEGVNRFEWVYRAFDGEEFRVEVLETAALIRGRKIIWCVWKGIREREESLQALSESESKFRNLVERSFAGVYLIQDGLFRYVNSWFRDMLGYTVEEMTDKMTPEDIVLTEDYDGFTAENIRKRLAGEFESIRYEVRLVTKGGEIKYAETYGARILYKGRPAAMGTVVDITDRRRVEMALQESEERYRAVFETTPAATIIIENDTTISLCNSEFERLSGYGREEIEGKRSWTEFVVRGDLEGMAAQHELRRQDRDRAARRYECRIVTRYGEIRTVFLVVDMIRGTTKSVASLIDITDRKLMEEELARTRNLESIGTLAGGIAHDFNNLLMAVTGYISLASLCLSPGDETYTLLEEAERISLAGKDLTDKLITFSKGGFPVRKTINLTCLIEGCISSILGDSQIEHSFSCPDDLFEVEADEVQIRQVMQNLIQNAREATPSGGLIRITVANESLLAGNTLPLPPGDYVEISVEDQGCGIKAEDLPRIFDPYFSTKGMGAEKGMGLGLAVAYSVIKRHNGHIGVKSTPGRGATVRVYLPALSDMGPKDEKVVSSVPPAGKVLFMDDDDHVRNIGVKLISHLGYEVTPARDGDEAMDIYRQALKSGQPFDVVVLDLTVKGGMGGKEAFDGLRSLDPHVRGIVCSGYTDDPVISRFSEYGFLGAIVKPYKMEELKAVLLRVMPAGIRPAGPITLLQIKELLCRIENLTGGNRPAGIALPGMEPGRLPRKDNGMEKEQLRTLLGVVKGTVAPDTVIKNGKIVNVFTNEIQENLMVAVKDGFIVSIEEDKDVPSYRGSPVIDASGQYLCPGFIDAHTHLDAIYAFHQFVPYAILGGTTTVVTELTMIGTSCGMESLSTYIESTKGYPLKCYFVAPPLTPPFPKMEAAAGITFKEFSRLLKRDDFLGIGEAYWTRAVEGDDRVLKQAALAISLGKRIDGHSAGARGKKLLEYLATGVTSCHESIQMDEVVEKLRFGVTIMIREGFVRQELPLLHKIKDLSADMRRVMLVSDFFDAVMLTEEGYLDSIARKAIAYGFTPMEAIKMLTINPADYLGLRHVGAIAPLRHADILFLKDLREVSIDRVMAKGEIVAEKGRFTGKAPEYRFPESVMHTIKTDKVTEEDFRVKARRKDNTIRVIQVANPTITREISYEPEVGDGYLLKNLKEDIIPTAVINRGKGKRMGRGFVKGTGITDGAVATTVIWDTCNIFVLGSEEEDMKVAVNRLIDMQGGIAISKHGKIIYEFPMPAFGLMPLVDIKEIARKTRELKAKLGEIGASFEKPFLTIQTIPFTGLPFLRITDKGLADIKNRKLVPLFIK